MSRLTVVMFTYNRFKYAEETLRSALDHITWGDESFNVHIADDGSPGDYTERLRAIAGGYSNVCTVGVSSSARSGYGANYNIATQCIHDTSDYILCLEDDWRLTRDLDLYDLAQCMHKGDWPTEGEIGCIRLGYLGYTQSLEGTFLRRGKHHFILLNPYSAEPHVFAGHPRLETVSFQRWAGSWPEGIDPNATEFSVAKAVRRHIAWPIDFNPGENLFEHIGAERAR